MHKLIATSLLAALLIAGSVTNTNVIRTVDSEMIGPFKEFDEDTKIKFSYRLNNNLDKVYEELRCFNATTGEAFSKSTRKMHYTGTGTVSFEFPVSLSKYFSSNGIRFQLTIYSDNIVISRSIASIYPMEQKEIHVTRDKIKSLVSKDVAFKIENSNMITYRDDFNFTGFKDYVDADNYHSLDFRGNTFLSNQENLNYSSANLTYLDSKRVFKYLGHDGYGKINIRLGITNDNEKKSIKVVDNIYVNPYTLDISSFQLPDTVKTNKIYFPVNKKTEFLGKSFSIVLFDCGLNKYKLIFDITYDVFRDLVGNCSNSDYCIKGMVE